MIDKMASSHRRMLLKQAASGERELASDVIARIALDEIAELDDQITILKTEQAASLKLYRSTTTMKG